MSSASSRLLILGLFATIATTFLGAEVATAREGHPLPPPRIQDVFQPGAPAEMIGHFGRSPVQCRSFNRKIDDVTHVTLDYWTSCGGMACESMIVGHVRQDGGFTLSFRSFGNPDGWSAFYRMHSPDLFEAEYPTGEIETLVRCTERDVIAGIGLMEGDSGLISRGFGTMFAVRYAQAAADLCPDLSVDKKKADDLVEVATLAIFRAFRDGTANPMTEGRAAETAFGHAEDSARDARFAAERDKAELTDFCDHVSDRYGPDGTLIPDLMTDRRRRA